MYRTNTFPLIAYHPFIHAMPSITYMFQNLKFEIERGAWIEFTKSPIRTQYQKIGWGIVLPLTRRSEWKRNFLQGRTRWRSRSSSIIAGVNWCHICKMLRLFVPQARKPNLWGAPLVPWIPVLSIAVNIFLLGSIGKASFIRFVVWTGIILLYYIFFGLHASYDTAKASAMERMEKVDVLG